MLTKEENELLTRTDPGTPAGEWMRRYWLPVALSEELPAGGAPVPVRLLGEDLVLFRDEQARPGLLGLHCSHRGADLSYGRLEDGGLRCIYHGWLYDVHGNCLEQPGEPATRWTHWGGRDSAEPSGLEEAQPAFRWTDSGGRDSVDSSGLEAQPAFRWTDSGGRDSAEPSGLEAQPASRWTDSGGRDLAESSGLEAQPAFRWTDSGGRDSVDSSGLESQSALRTPHSAIKHRAYPCLERAGTIFTYMGPGEPPLFPNYEFLSVPEEQVFAIKLFSECNYLQGSEGNYDWVHTTFLHHNRRGWGGANGSQKDGALEPLSGRGPHPHGERLEARLKPWGLQHIKVTQAPEGLRYSFGTFLMPAIFCFGGGVERGNDGHSANWHVPIDDQHHWKFTYIFNRATALDKTATRRGRADMTPDYKPIRNKGNRYLQDRESMKYESYSGMATVFQPQDLCVTEGAGPIQDRTQEHLVSSDVAIVAARHMLFKAIGDVKEGLEAPYVVRDPAQNSFPYTLAYSAAVPEGTDWKAYFDELDERRRMRNEELRMKS